MLFLWTQGMLTFASWGTASDYNTLLYCNILVMSILTKETFFYIAKLIRINGKIKTHQLFLQAHVKGKRECRLQLLPILEHPNLCGLASCMPGMNCKCVEAQILLNPQGGQARHGETETTWGGPPPARICLNPSTQFVLKITFSLCAVICKGSESQ